MFFQVNFFHVLKLFIIKIKISDFKHKGYPLWSFSVPECSGLKLATVYVHFIARILMKICFYYKKDSSLIFSHLISAENKDFTLFQLENTLKFFAGQKKSLIGSHQARGPPVAGLWFRHWYLIIIFALNT
jgi:hypothetical protein